MKILDQSNDQVLLSYASDQASLLLIGKNEPIKRDVSSGRIAFACPTKELKNLEEKVKKFDEKRIHTKLTSLETPGKANVEVVILTDPDGHEICFVGDEGFKELSLIDPNSDELLQNSIKNDWSDEWEQKQGKN